MRLWRPLFQEEGCRTWWGGRGDLRNSTSQVDFNLYFVSLRKCLLRVGTLALDFTIHHKNVESRGIRRTDFIANPWLADDSKKKALVQRCVDTLDDQFASLSISTANHGGKPTYKIRDFEHELVLRIIGSSISSLTKVRQSNRVNIIRSLQSLLSEGVDYRVYRLDIRSFFENVNPQIILDRLRSDSGFSRQNLRLLSSFFAKLRSLGIFGLPRGMAISSILSEYLLRDFDREISRQFHVFYYARFVDDIIFITSGNEDPKKEIQFVSRTLPSGLKLNGKKCTWMDCSKEEAELESIKEIEYLGYQFIVPTASVGKPKSRNVSTDIAFKKRSKIKTRIVKSALQFLSDGNFDDFRDRIKLLSTNTTVYDRSLGVKRKIGIYYNYRLIDGLDSSALDELDSFLKRFLLSKTGRLSTELQRRLTKSQKRRLLKFNFRAGFNEKVHTHFPGPRIAHLMSCWDHG